MEDGLEGVASRDLPCRRTSPFGVCSVETVLSATVKFTENCRTETFRIASESAGQPRKFPEVFGHPQMKILRHRPELDGRGVGGGCEGPNVLGGVYASARGAAIQSLIRAVTFRSG